MQQNTERQHTQGGNLFTVQQEARNFQRIVRERSLSFLVAAFGLVAGLAWNDAIGALIAHLFPSTGDTVIAKFVYAVAITVVVVLITSSLMGLSKNDGDRHP